MEKAILFILLCISFCSNAQDFSGNWSGIIITNGQDIKDADVIYLEISSNVNKVSGLSRIELLDEVEFAVKAYEGTIKRNTISISEKTLKRSSNTRKSPVCKLTYELEFDDSTAYLKGRFKSTDCRNNQGEIVLFRSDHNVSTEKDPQSTHLWKHRFVKAYNKGYPAPELMKIEQQNFKFQPIYFDHDMSEIKPEFYSYLNKMARVLDGIHDLRVEITGHTDAVGTDLYNIGLSERRAKAIREYFKNQGIEPEKLEIDFKGKRQPIDTNKTKEGKQRNRRVDFKFI
ncbi:OmpA family protein [Brumimicrobium mesophilum]|uniref:OmpA family protein n=1 Tax=Brumimicrobium mesophilum TaxID=392717 RepID=UPI000D13F5B3|nr:OmpA family protein [Brumimicrobium mesophilum]